MPSNHTEQKESFAGRPVTVLDSQVRRSPRGQKVTITVTLGGPDGSVDPVRLERAEALRLLGTLGFHLRHNWPRAVPYAAKEWLARRSVSRALALVQSGEDVDAAEKRMRQALPDVAEYLAEQFSDLERLIRRSRTKPETILRKARRAALVLVETLRHDR